MTTDTELGAYGNIFVLGIKFPEPLFQHAIVPVADMHSGNFENHIDKSELFQNYNIYIGNDEDYRKNTKCPGGPFNNSENASSYVHDERIF